MIWPHNWFFRINFHNAGILLTYNTDFEWTLRRSLKTGTKRDLPPNEKIWCFCWRIFAKLSQFPVEFSSVEELKKARWFSFRGKSNKEAAPASTFGFVVAQAIKQLLKTKRNRQPQLACTWTNERTRKCLQLAPAVTNLVEHRIKTTPSKLNRKTMEPS